MEINYEKLMRLASVRSQTENKIPLTDSVTSTLAERGKRYGSFDSHACITQELKLIMRIKPQWAALTPDKQEALEMIAHKIGRILNGDPNYADSWVDIAGYATLIVNNLNTTQASK